MRKRFGLIGLILFFLVACSSEKADELLQEVEKNQNDVTSVHTTYREIVGGEKKEGTETFHFDEGQSTVEFQESNLTLFKEGEVYELDTIRDVSGISGEELWVIKAEIDYREEFQRNIITFYKQFDDDFFNHFDIEEEDDLWILTYNPEEKIAKEFYTKLTEYMVGEMGMFSDDLPASAVTNVVINEFELMFEIDRETKRITLHHFKEDTTFDLDDKPIEFDRTLLFTYSDYNDAEEIVVPEEAIDVTDGIVLEDPNDPPGDDANVVERAFKDVLGSDVDDPELEEAAAAYLDGLIQATVFQDIEAAVHVSNETMDESEAELHQAFFREVYIDNTKANMFDVVIDDEFFEYLADGFFTGLSKTNYEIIDSTYTGIEGSVVVTLTVEGIDDNEVYLQTEEDLGKAIEDKDLSVEEFVELNLEILGDSYASYEDLLDPVEIEVVVTTMDERYDFFVYQDDFLQAFIQQ